jgi:polyisoprenoid-binding protein YceI
MLLIKGFKFDNATMQEHFNENYMESDKYTKSTFAGAITNINEVNFTKDGVYNVIVAGALEIHGVKKQVTVPGTIEIKGGKVTAKSKFNIAIADFGIKGSYIGSKIASNIEITVDCKYD